MSLVGSQNSSFDEAGDALAPVTAVFNFLRVQEEPVPTHKIMPANVFVGGLPKDATSAELRQHFERFTHVLKAQVIHDEKGRCRGYGFLTLTDPSEVEFLLRRIDSEEVGRFLLKGMLQANEILRFGARWLHLGQGMRRLPPPPPRCVCGGGLNHVGTPFPMLVQMQWPIPFCLVPKISQPMAWSSPVLRNQFTRFLPQNTLPAPFMPMIEPSRE